MNAHTDEEIKAALKDKINVHYVSVERWVAEEKDLPSMNLLAEIEHETDKAMLLDWVEPWSNRNERNSAFRDEIREVWVPKSAVNKAVDANEVD